MTDVIVRKVWADYYALLLRDGDILTESTYINKVIYFEW